MKGRNCNICAQRTQLFIQPLIASADVPRLVQQRRFPLGNQSRQHQRRPGAQIGCLHHRAAERPAALHHSHAALGADIRAMRHSEMACM